MASEMVIRPVGAGDVDGVTPLAGSRDRAENRVRAAGLGDDSMYVAELSGSIAGVVSIRWAGGCLPPHPWLYGLHVATAVRRTGVGRALLRTAEGAARERGAEHLTLDVDVDDAAAIGFYTALGYAVVRPHRHRWRSLDPRTGAVTAEGAASTSIMQRPL